MAKQKSLHALRRRKIPEYILIYFGLTFFALLVIFPLAYMVLTAFKPLVEVVGDATLLPKNPTFENFKVIFRADDAQLLASRGFEANLITSFFVTIFLFAVNTVVSLIVCSLAGYAFARFRFKYKNAIFMLFMAVMLIPAEMIIIPLYSAYVQMGMLDTYWPLILPSFFGTNVTMIFMFKQFYTTVPDALFEAARLDGCNELMNLFLIMMPVTLPVYVAQIIMNIGAAYGDVYNPTLYVLSVEKYTLPQYIMALEKLFSTGSAHYQIPYNLLSAVLIIVLLPAFVAYSFLQKFFLGGVVTSGLK